jgi:hypothetical protein
VAPKQVLKRGDRPPHRPLRASACTFDRLVTGKTPFRGAAAKDILRAQGEGCEAEPAKKAEPRSVPAAKSPPSSRS